MLRAFCLACTAIALSTGYASADADADLGKNAALKYWQAFAQLPKLTDGYADKLNAECLTMPLDAHARELVNKSAYALDMLHYGAALPRCNWGVDHEPGIATRLPQAQASRALTAIALLRARLRFADGQPASAVNDLVDCLTLARHISVNGVSIMVLVGYSIETRTGQALGAGLPKLSADMLEKLRTRLKALPEGGSPVKALPFEEKSFDISFVRPLKEATSKESLEALLSQLFATEGKLSEVRERMRLAMEGRNGTVEVMLEHAAEMKAGYLRLTPSLSRSMEECVAAWEQETKLQSANPVFKEFASSLPHMRWRQLQAEVRRALLLAAVTVQLNGRDALGAVPDPVLGGPFEYVAFDGGFELRSKLELGEPLRAKLKMLDAPKPLTLTVGERKK